MRRTLLVISIVITAAIVTGCAGPKFPFAASSGSVQIRGQSAVRAGESVEFVTSLPVLSTGGVQWSVNGVVGGDQSFGTISSTGEFTAPLELPLENKVFIRATSMSNSDVFGEAEVTLLNPVPVLHSATAAATSDSYEVDITGSNFARGAVVKVNGVVVATTRQTRSRLKATFASSIATASTAQVSVANPEPGQAASESFVLQLVRPSRPQRGVLTEPSLPAQTFDYVSYATTSLPTHYQIIIPPHDNMPADNAITNAGATLGRVLFYDRRLSVNNTVSCASCHRQMNGFADPNRFSTGFAGGQTNRHGAALGNARFYGRGRFFWDERALTLEQQALMPIQDSTEMGMTLAELNSKLQNTSFYPPLFQAAFGTPDVTSDRISKALAQFIRAMVTYQSKFDSVFMGSIPNFSVLTAQEQRGLEVFNNSRCGFCHTTNTHISADIFNNGLDAIVTDAGAGQGRFKAPSLRNSGVRVRFMHDGRFTSLEQVVEFYNSGVQNNPHLSQILRDPQGNILRLNLSEADKAALVAFLHTLTDNNFLNDPKFRDPF